VLQCLNRKYFVIVSMQSHGSPLRINEVCKCVAVRDSVLKCVAVRDKVLWSSPLRINEACKCVAVRDSVLQCVAVCRCVITYMCVAACGSRHSASLCMNDAHQCVAVRDR